MNKIKLCILTQTATDISDYYKSFFNGLDVFFVTFKEENPSAVDFIPKSTWSDGRNRLWNEVKGKYDYYMFIDDDLIFYKAKHSKCSLFQRISQRFGNGIVNSYEKCEAPFFFANLEKWLIEYKPEVLTIKNLNDLHNQIFDTNALSKGSYARRIGWFDAQLTIFSDYAAQRLLPYDTSISGWASAQILIYLLSYNIFRSKAISVMDIAANNTFHTGAYVEDYKSNLDCKNMIEHICKTTNVKFEDLFDMSTNHVNTFLGKENILSYRIDKNSVENYKDNFKNSALSGIDKLMINNDLNF